MRLDELTGIKHLRNKTPVDIINWLEAEFGAGRTKFRRLGSGTNGVALTDGKTVFKFWMFDSAYELFVEHCLKNQDDPFLPKFKSKIKTIPRFINLDVQDYDGNKIDGSKVHYVKMEMLQPYKGLGGFYLFLEREARAKIEEKDDLANFVGFETLMQFGQYFTGEFNHDLRALFNDIMRSYNGHADDTPYEKFQKVINPQLMKFIKSLAEIDNAMSGEYRFDPGNRNMALRGDQIVFLDPVVNDADMELNETFLKLIDL